jgi:hypothetical protein
MGRPRIDLTGQTFGRLSVLSRAEDRIRPCGRHETYWLCRCECGNDKTVRSSHLMIGSTQSCGCITTFHDLTGQTFGRLTALSRAEDSKCGRSRWLCSCTCGNEGTIQSCSLINGNTKSCGCFKSEQSSLIRRKRPFWATYHTLCHGAKKRNIPVELTLEEFTTFTTKTACYYCGSKLTWNMHVKKGDYTGHNIDRMDNSKGYLKDNCVECCHNCNMGKRDIFTHAQWYRLMEPFRTGELKYNAIT